jgi:D-arabinose 1-dehydrogenase-like Zn-dependent alcohol dehydrogenase
MRAIAIDGGDAKRDLCLKMGAEEFIDFTKEKDVPAKVKEIADGIGAHGVLVTAYQAYNGKSQSMSIMLRMVQLTVCQTRSSMLVTASAPQSWPSPSLPPAPSPLAQTRTSSRSRT